MASIHIMQGDANGKLFQVVVHAPVPAGNNSAGVSWADALKGSGLNKSLMTVGTTPGTISNTESNQIANGTVMEANFLWEDNPAWSNAERQADITLRAQQLIADLQAQRSGQLKFFGYSQ
jgi:hypothetical protein